MILFKMTISKLNKSYNEQILNKNDESNIFDDSTQTSRLGLTPQAKRGGLDASNKTYFTDSVTPTTSRYPRQFKFQNTNYDIKDSYFYEENEKFDSQKSISYLSGLTDQSEARSNTFEESDEPKTPKISSRHKQNAINNTLSNLTKTHESFDILSFKNSANELESIPIEEWYLSKCFTRQSQFSDVFGRKILHEVDWEYLDSRYWDMTHPYLRDKFYEYIFAYSLTENVCDGSHRKTEASMYSTDNDLEEFLRQTNMLIDDNNIIKNTLVKKYATNDSINSSGKNYNNDS